MLNHADMLTVDELASVAGGMIKRQEEVMPQTPGDDGVTWVPYGTVKVYLGGVQIS